MSKTILKPKCDWIEGRCFRNFVSTFDPNAGSLNYNDEPSLDWEEPVQCEAEDDHIVIQRISPQKFSTTFHVAKIYFALIIGARGATRQRIENETSTNLKIPSKGEDGEIVIIGRNPNKVRQSRLKVERLVEHARKRQPFTHFLSIPMNSQEIQESFMKFKKTVLEKYGEGFAITEDLFQEPLKLHLTLCVFVLGDEQERTEAVSALTEASHIILKKQTLTAPITLDVRGLEIMNDDPSEVDVLYGKVQTLNSGMALQNFADELVKELTQRGVVTQQYERVKLHITLMNSRFKKSEEKTDLNTNNPGNRAKFKANRILKELADYSFGKMTVSEVHLSIRHSIARNGYYTPSTKISLLEEGADHQISDKGITNEQINEW